MKGEEWGWKRMVERDLLLDALPPHKYTILDEISCWAHSQPLLLCRIEGRSLEIPDRLGTGMIFQHLGLQCSQG